MSFWGEWGFWFRRIEFSVCLDLRILDDFAVAGAPLQFLAVRLCVACQKTQHAWGQEVRH